MKEVDKEDKHIPYTGKVWEPPEQETLEEAAEQFKYTDGIYGFKEGVKWQKKRNYSEEEVINILITLFSEPEDAITYFEQFKKK